MPDLASRPRGTFPFGRPNTNRPMRRAAQQARAIVVGVYPSAFHVAWSPPPSLDPREPSGRARPLIGSLAVDVEPVVFWDGLNPQPLEELETWKREVDFDEARHGTVAVGRNGPSGAGVDANVLMPLRLDRSAVAFTDAVPWFFVKGGKGSQGDAMASRFAPIAEHLGADPGSLPTRPTPRRLVDIAASPWRRDSLRREIVESGASLVITLGQEALEAIRRVADQTDGVPEALFPAEYGGVGRLRIDGHERDLLPLVHPGFQRQTTDQRWRSTLAEWAEAAPTLLT